MGAFGIVEQKIKSVMLLRGLQKRAYRNFDFQNSKFHLTGCALSWLFLHPPLFYLSVCAANSVPGLGLTESIWSSYDKTTWNAKTGTFLRNICLAAEKW